MECLIGKVGKRSGDVLFKFTATAEKNMNAAEKQKTSPKAGLISFNMFVDHLRQFKH